MPELPPTTPSEMALAEREIALAEREITAAAVSIVGAGRALRAYAQGVAVTRLMEGSKCAEEAMRAARNAARLLF